MHWYLACFARYARFSGRSQRREYWMFVLFNCIFASVLALADVLLRTGYVLYGMYLLAILLPSTAVAVRRLHDIDRSGWWLLVGLIPVVGNVVLLVFMATAGTPGANRFGAPEAKPLSTPWPSEPATSLAPARLPTQQAAKVQAPESALEESHPRGPSPEVSRQRQVKECVACHTVSDANITSCPGCRGVYFRDPILVAPSAASSAQVVSPESARLQAAIADLENEKQLAAARERAGEEARLADAIEKEAAALRAARLAMEAAEAAAQASRPRPNDACPRCGATGQPTQTEGVWYCRNMHTYRPPVGASSPAR